ncbi:MAG: hypothetical protein Q9179_000423 [Wetmoreana sp. 5 TL-2023]
MTFSMSRLISYLPNILTSFLPQQPLRSSPHLSPISFSTTWHLLGPFQTGTREATWGADPLESLGGFHSLTYNDTARYHSSLATNGTVGWSILTSDNSFPTPKSPRAELLVRFQNSDWEFLQKVYGWAVLQWQAWVRGTISLHGDKRTTVILYTDQILEFWVDDEPYFGGDFYAYRRAPLVLRLDPGEHRIDVRVIRDVRAMGGVEEPTVSLQLEAEVSEGGLHAVEESLLLPDMVDGRLVSSLGSVNVRNEEDDWIDVLNIESVTVGFVVRMRRDSSLNIAPGQSRPLAFDIATSNVSSVEVSLRILYKIEGLPAVFQIQVMRHVFHPRHRREPQKITYPHPGGIVSYAILRPASEKAVHHSKPGASLPVVLGLHGAGVEADSDLVRHSLDSTPDLRGWVLFPSGVTPWSGDDWRES